MVVFLNVVNLWLPLPRETNPGDSNVGSPTNKCDRLRQKQDFGEKISFADFSLELINNNF